MGPRELGSGAANGVVSKSGPDETYSQPFPSVLSPSTRIMLARYSQETPKAREHQGHNRTTMLRGGTPPNIGSR